MKYRDDVGCLLNKASRLSKLRVNRKLAELGLTFTQLVIIKHLYETKKTGDDQLILTPASIAEQLGYDRPTISGIIDRLLKQGFVSREINPHDRRSQTIDLTERSREMIQKMDVFFEEVNKKTLDGFQECDIKLFKNYLLRVIGNLDEQKAWPDNEAKTGLRLCNPKE